MCPLPELRGIKAVRTWAVGLGQPHTPAAETAVIVGEQSVTVVGRRGGRHLLVRQSPLTATLTFAFLFPQISPWLFDLGFVVGGRVQLASAG